MEQCWLGPVHLSKQDGGLPTDADRDQDPAQRREGGIVTGKHGGVREAKKTPNLRDPPVVLGKHGTRLYPWR